MPIPHCKDSVLQMMPVMQSQSDVSARPSRELLDGESNGALFLRDRGPTGDTSTFWQRREVSGEV